jgi:hypothetical protein
MLTRQPMRRRVVLIAVLAGLLLAAGMAAPGGASAAGRAPASRASSTSASGSGSAVWLCRPGQTPDPCAGSLATTFQRPDGTSRVVHPISPRRHPIDCFYVYPTVSEEPTANADLSVTPQITAIAQYQAARFSQLCDVYAPVYRQITLTALNGGVTSSPPNPQLAYDDVLAAWKEYLSRDNHGRGVVLIGHSQGTAMLTELIQQQIDPDPAARRLLVSALLLGGNVTTARGSDRGGSFTNVPTCTRDFETGCAIAYSTFDQTPPSDSFFGRAPASTTGPALQVACTNPASLTENRPRTAATIQRSEPFPGLIGAALQLMYGGPPPTATTPYLVPADRYTIQCQTLNGAHVLDASPQAGVKALTPQPSPEWGLHLVDANLALGDLLVDVARQTWAYEWHLPSGW